jgi:endoglucanase
MLSRRAVNGGLLAALALGAPARAEEQTIAARRLPRLNRGFNLPGWADRIHGRAPGKAVLEDLSDLGFQSVRLPVDAARIVSESGRDVLAHIASSARDLTASGYSVTFDMHGDQAMNQLFVSSPQEAEALLAAAWGKLASVLGEFSPEDSFAELLNEPPMSMERWLPLRDRLAETVRKSCPEHTLLTGAAGYQGINDTISEPPLDDANVIAAVHYYTPMGFTHQGADWTGTALEQLCGLPFPARRDDAAILAMREQLSRRGDEEAVALLDNEFEADWTEARIGGDFDRIGEWSRQSGTPVVLNEFGVLGGGADPASRARWISSVRRAAERNGMAWTYWELDQGFGFVGDREDAGSFDLALVDALIEAQ